MKLKPIHPFPARMAPDVALRSLAGMDAGAVVLDPMAGSGTVLRQALSLGHHAIGFDVDPLAVLMSRVWTGCVDPAVVTRELETMIDEARDVDLRSTPLPWHDEETQQFARYWFAPAQRRDLSRIANVLHEHRRPRLGTARRAALDVLQIGLSRLIVTKDQVVSLARDTSHSRPHKVTDTCSFDVMAGWRRSVAQLLERLGAGAPAEAARVELADARNLPLPDESVDSVLTSPPYLNQIDYMRGHRLALIWLGYSLAELRTIRSGSIGTERGHEDSNAADTEVMRQMVRPDDVAPRHKRMVLRYANDLRRMMAQTARVLRHGGRATFVIGDSCLREAFVCNSSGLIRAARLAGLTFYSKRVRTLPDANRYLPMTAGSALSKRMRTESVITFRK